MIFENMLTVLRERCLPQKGFFKICQSGPIFLITFQIIVARADEIFGIASGAVISVWGRHIGAWLSLDSPMPAWRISVTNCGGHFLNN